MDYDFQPLIVSCVLFSFEMSNYQVANKIIYIFICFLLFIIYSYYVYLSDSFIVSINLLYSNQQTVYSQSHIGSKLWDRVDTHTYLATLFVEVRKLQP